MFQQLKSWLRLSNESNLQAVEPINQKKYFEQLFLKYNVDPETLFSDEKADMAALFGREMQLQRLKNRHALVLEMGELARKINLSHERITINYQKSLQASFRQEKLNELEQLRNSDEVSKKEYEKAVIKAWMADPDFSEYLELLKRLTLKRLRQDPLYSSASKELQNELVDFQINRRILVELINFK